MKNEYDSNEMGLVSLDEENEAELPAVKSDVDPEDYYKLPNALKSRSLIWAVISVICGALSILLCPYYYVAYVLVAVSIVFSLVSRRNLGFFEKYSIMGIIFGIMGFVFGTFSLIIDLLGLF